MTKTKTKQTNITDTFDSKNLFESITKEFNSEDIYKKDSNININLIEQTTKTNRVRLGVFVVAFILIIFYMTLPFIIEVLTSYITFNT